jgi:hypothetical protein
MQSNDNKKRNTLILVGVGVAVAALTLCVCAGALILLLTHVNGKDSPERVAKEWMDALLTMDGNKAAKLTCRDQQTTLEDAGMWLGLFGALSGGKPKVDLSDVRFKTVRQDSGTAAVQVTGDARLSIGGMVNTKHFDRAMDMVKEDGRWKWCGP